MIADPPGDPLAAPANDSASEVSSPETRRQACSLSGALRSTWASFTCLAVAVVGFAGAWARGALLIDGPGIAIYVRLALHHLVANGRVSYWIPEMWTGTPAWALGPSFPVLALVPLAALVGSVTAVKVAILALQIAGAWGAWVLARSLWDDGPAAFLAGLVYGLNPIVISHGALAGSETSMGVIAAAPWLVWSLRRGLRGEGTRYLVAAGLVSAFAVLQEAEFAYGLAALCACLVAMEVGRIRQALSDASARRLAGRAALVVAVCLGSIAHWLLPFLSLHQWFVLSPRPLVEADLVRGIGNTVGRELGIFLHRTTLDGVVTPDRGGLVASVFYLGRVPAAFTALTAVLVARRREERTLTAVLLASAAGLWMSTGAVSLAAGGPVLRRNVLGLLLAGLVAGLIVGGFLRRLELRRATLPLAIAVACSLFLAPYASPFILLRGVVPLLSSIRFPRFYILAVLGVALGTAWPVAHFRRWFLAGHHRTAKALAGALAVVVAAAVMADVWPYRSFYRLKPPPSAAAYRQAETTLAQRPMGARIAIGSVDPRIVSTLLDKGAELSSGWPHPVAGVQVWRLTVGALLGGPPGYSNRALGLSATAYSIREIPIRQGTASQAVAHVNVLANPTNLPLVRTYDQALGVQDPSIAAELAVAMAHRNVGTVVGGPAVSRSLGRLAFAAPVPARACSDHSMTRPLGGLVREVDIACALRPWLEAGVGGQELFGLDKTPGASFTAKSNGLRGVSVWFFDPPGDAELVLREVAPNGAPGPEVVRTKVSNVDENGLTEFRFDPIADSAGKRYVYDVECPTCYTELEPQTVASVAPNGSGNLLLNGSLDSKHLAAFAPVYDRASPAQPSATRVDTRRPAPDRWQIRTSGGRPTLLVVSEAYFPGWRARVDGHSVRVLQADGAFIGVLLEPGEHQIVLEYPTPTAAIVGRMITAVTLIGLIIAGLGSRARRRRHALEVGPPSVEPSGKDALGAG